MTNSWSLHSVIKVMLFLGSPYSKHGCGALSQDNLMKYFPIAVSNDIQFFYLTRAIECNHYLDHYLVNSYRALKERRKRLILTLVKLAELLNSRGIEYILNRTLKPYPSLPRDIDLLFLKDRDLIRTVKVLRSEGYKVDSRNKYSVTFTHPKLRIPIDLYRELIFCNAIYIDKYKLGSLAEVNFQSIKISTLQPEIDLLNTIAHYVYHDRYFTLESFYTTVYNLATFTKKQINHFIDKAKELRLTLPAKIILALTRLLYILAFENSPRSIDYIYEELSCDSDLFVLLEKARLVSEGVPLRYNPLLFIKLFISKTGITSMRKIGLRTATNSLIGRELKRILGYRIEVEPTFQPNKKEYFKIQ